MSATVWISVGVGLPHYVDFVWVKSPEGVSLAYFTGREFQVAATAGDAEGLSIEYIESVEYWAALQEPKFP